MLKDTLQEDLPFLWKKFSAFTADESTGMDFGEVKKQVTAMASNPDLLLLPRPVHKARAFEFLTKNLRIEVNPHDFFPTFDCWNRDDRPLNGFLNYFHNKVRRERIEHNKLWDQINHSGASNSWIDFDHSVPDWDFIFPMGFPGIRENARQARVRLAAKGPLSPSQAAYFDGIDITYGSLLEMIGRFRDYAMTHAKGNPRMLLQAECLEHLRTGAPATMYEALMFIYLIFMFSEHLDRFQVRSLGNLDNLLLPFYERDIQNGTYSDADIRILFDYFLMQWGSINNYWGHPFYLGGTNADGSSCINPLSYLILEEFDKLAITSPKIQLKIAKNTPDAFIDVALKMIRKGHSSLVFCGEEGMRRAMMSCGVSEENARTAYIRGCYEFGPLGYYMANCTGGGHVNMLKPFEWIFHDGYDALTKTQMGHQPLAFKDIRTFDDFYECYITNLEWSVEAIITVANDFERFQAEISPSNVFSGTVQTSLERGVDAFWKGCYYNSSSLLVTGIGTAVDALVAVKDFVFDRKEVTLEEMKAALDANWVGYEKLHERVMHSPLKYGNGLPEVDKYAVRLSQFLSTIINGRPNSRGGRWRASGHCAKQYFVLGQKTMATPDGRYAGEEMSKNLSPTQGMDRKGLTALIKSVTSIDSLCFPGDYPLDVMLHPATVQGDDGLTVWRSLLRMYLNNYGHAVHFNIFDAETLKEAQRHPEKYEGLQIRVCGWNVRFTTMAKVEQDMYIRRAENLAE